MLNIIKILNIFVSLVSWDIGIILKLTVYFVLYHYLIFY